MTLNKYSVVVGMLLAYIFISLAATFFLASNPYTPKARGLIYGNTQLPDMRDIRDIPTRKDAFIQLLLPLIERKNAALLEVRQNLKGFQQSLATNGKLDRADKVVLKRLANRYGVDTKDVNHTAVVAELLVRVDTLPASMVLAQAAAESGWGTSRFAREGMNLFGQWCYTKGCGLVPKRRSTGARHEVQTFDSLEQTINAYYHNINSHRAYEQVRQVRAELRAEQQPLSGRQLVTGLKRYSSRGQKYIDELVALIEYNQLDKFEANTDLTDA